MLQLREKSKDAYSWHSLKPYLGLLWSAFLECRRLASLLLAVIIQGSENRDILFQDVGRGCGVLHCAKWSRDEVVKSNCALAIEQVRAFSVIVMELFWTSLRLGICG